MRARALLLLLPFLSLGCGGAFAPAGSSDGDAGGDADGTHDGGPGKDSGPFPDGEPPPDVQIDSPAPWSPVCPASTPALGSPCSTPGTQCEYGSAWWSVSCDVVVSCQGGQWETMQASYVPCSAKPGPNAAACPSSFSAVPAGSACSDTGLSCLYSQGVCSCNVPLGGPVQIDAGQQGYWGCLPEQGCPFPRPRL
ncbi:MAG TPA: hypothetical protein VIF09_14540, partial [Polyangiaceae bacterium]